MADPALIAMHSTISLGRTELALVTLRVAGSGR